MNNQIFIKLITQIMIDRRIPIKTKLILMIIILGQHLWPQKYKLCAGKLQSPIAISTSKAIPLPLPALEMIGYHDFLPMPQIFANNGQTSKYS